MKKFIERVTEETRRETTERMLAESKGVQPDRVAAGEILFSDKEGGVWAATNWVFVPRYLSSGGLHSKEKARLSAGENPEFLKALINVNLFIGPIDTNEAKTKSKGIILVTLKDSKSKTIIVGRHLPKDSDPLKINNSEFSDAGFKRRTKAGSQLQTLTASHFLEGHRTEAIRISDNDVPHYIFKGLEELKSRILTNMKGSSYAILKDPAVLKATEEFFNGGAVQFDWSEVGEIMAPQDKAKFGIYLISELSYPFLIWGGKSIGNFPNFSTMTFFAVPTDNTNTSYDSYLRGTLKTGEIGNLKVSSKAMSSGSNKGARSSILPKLHSMGKNLTNLQVLSNKFLVAMLPYFKTSSRGAQTIYPFMIKEVMKLKIQDPVKFWNDICKLHGKRQGKLTAQEMKDLERDVHLVQKFVQNSNGIPLTGIGVRAPLNQNAAKYIQPFQWKDFCKYISDIFCDAITYGLNHDTSDFRPSISWQVTLNNMEFVRSGKAVFTVSQASANSGGMVFDSGKQSAGDPSRNITWLGVRPL
jgi:hypothetical protein